MKGIYKRTKTGNFTQIHNEIRNTNHLPAMGLVFLLVSLPENWVINKKNLYQTFGKAMVEKCIPILEDAKLWVSFKYRDGKLNKFHYIASDEPFTNEEISGVIDDLYKSGYKLMNISPGFEHLMQSKIAGNPFYSADGIDEAITSIGTEEDRTKNRAAQQLKNEDDFCPSSRNDFQDLNINDSASSFENHQLIKKEEKNKQKRKTDHINLYIKKANFMNSDDFRKALTEICDQHYATFAAGRWSKKAWHTLISAFVTQTIETGKFKEVPEHSLDAYALSSLHNIASNSDAKKEVKPKRNYNPTNPILLWDWLHDSSEENEYELDEVPY
ncbi:hypothetical protein [Bacillus dakarensis]|uniref:hypothetical protein n=1 Tax=Robertmurraya dakarensis TaxID=1926278 RepID=UPI0009819562|nr:hypothetical protein [Bacillus dakarensis]